MAHNNGTVANINHNVLTLNDIDQSKIHI
jgi:hypothetical protein